MLDRLKRLFGRSVIPEPVFPVTVRMVPLGAVVSILAGEEVSFPAYEIDLNKSENTKNSILWHYSPSTGSLTALNAAVEGK